MSNESRVQTSPGDEGRGPTLAKGGWIAALAVAAVAIAVIVYKESRQSPAPASSAASATSASGRPSEAAAVLLFADPDEAESSCGCGQIIRLVRGAAARGVAVREVARGSDSTLEREHRVTVLPTVLFLGSDGTLLARHEGEADETIDAIRTGLDRLAEAGR